MLSRTQFLRKLNLNNGNLFMDILRLRQQQHQDSIIIVVGQKRTGKSWASIRLAEEIDKNFDVKTNLFFQPSPFLKRFRECEKEVLIFDEGSESYDCRRFYEIQNTVFNSLLTREGYKENIIIITLPVLSDLDKRSIRLSTFLVTMKGFNPDAGYSFGNIYRLKLWDLKGKTIPIGIQNLLFYRASEKNLKEYERMKKDWNEKKSADNIDILERVENPEYNQKGLGLKDYIALLKKGIIDREQFIRRGLILNYNIDDLNNLVAMIEAETVQPDKEEKHKKDLRLSDYKKLLKQDVITEEYFKCKCMDLGYREQDLNIVIDGIHKDQQNQEEIL